MTSSDFSQLRELARDLGELGSATAVENMKRAVDSTAHLVKGTWNDKLYTEGHAKETGGSVTYTVGVARDLDLFATGADDFSSATIVAEIGPRRGRGRQAGVVRLLENGSIHNSPHGYGTAAIHEHEADFEAAIAFAEAAAAGRWNL